MSCFSDALDILSSCFVFASAGSGKTKALVDRYVKLLISGIKPRNILCLTFTNNAVFEMQTRISSILKRLLLDQDFAREYFKNSLYLGFPDEEILRISAKLFFDFQNDLANIKILTVHSFCKEILKSFPLEAEIFPNFEIIDEKESFDLLNEAKNNVFDKIGESEEFQSVVEYISFSKFEELIRNLYSDSLKFEILFEQNVDLDKYRQNLQKFFNLSPNIEFSDNELRYIEKFFKNQNLEDVFLTKSRTIRKKLPGDNAELSKTIAEKVFENFQNTNKEIAINKTVSFLKIAKLIFDEYIAQKKKRNYLDFSDVLIKTKSLLEKEFILFKACSRLDSVLIDEAQDLSVIQWKLVSLFCEGILAPGNNKTIFVVGDIKQSIYRFQDANYKLFSEFYDYCKRNCTFLKKPFKTVFFNKSFRSLPKILEVTDKVFIKSSCFAFGQSAAEYKRHVANRTDGEGSVEIIEKSDPSDIADFIENLLNLKNFLPGDILILSRNRDKLYNALIQKLQNKGIQIAPPDRILLNDNFLIMDIFALIKVCHDPMVSEYDLASILKSPYLFEVPLKDSELVKICKDRTVPLFENLKIHFKKECSVIWDYVENSKRFSPLNFLYYISTKIHKRAPVDQYVLSSFLDEAQKFFNNNPGNLLDFFYFFQQNEIFISSQISDKGAITFSTIHGAKGLEAPVVIVLDFSLKASKNKLSSVWKYDEKIFFGQKENNIMFFIKPNSSTSFSEANWILENEYKEGESELYRLLYVALTRARNCLYIIGEPNGKNVISLVYELRAL